jgi:hypothetical protein
VRPGAATLPGAFLADINGTPWALLGLALARHRNRHTVQGFPGDDLRRAAQAVQTVAQPTRLAHSGWSSPARHGTPQESLTRDLLLGVPGVIWASMS